MKRVILIARFGFILMVLLPILCQTTSAEYQPHKVAGAFTALDTQSPSAPTKLIATDRTHTTITLSWTSSHDNRAVKGYQVYRDGKRIVSTTKTTYTNKNLIPGQKYSYTVRAYDAAGNISENSTVLNVTTISDLQSPTSPEDLKASSTTYTSVSLSWKPSTDNVGIKGYEIYCNDKKAASTSATSYEYKKLAPGNHYTFYIKAYDKAGNYSENSSAISVSTSPDKASPSPPHGLKASSVALTQVNLTWSPASDNVKVRGYDIIRDGIKVGTTTKTSYLDKNLIPGKSYTYTVRASDTSGNLSGSSQPLNVTVLEDLQAPTAPSGLKIDSINGNSVSLTWTASTDDSKVAGYQIYCNGIVIATAAGTSRTVRSPFGLDGDEFWIKAYDLGGNLSNKSNTMVVNQ
jgi:chitodextrinase